MVICHTQTNFTTERDIYKSQQCAHLTVTSTYCLFPSCNILRRGKGQVSPSLTATLGIFPQILPQDPSWGAPAGVESELWPGRAGSLRAAAPQWAVLRRSLCHLWPDQGSQKWQGTAAHLDVHSDKGWTTFSETKWTVCICTWGCGFFFHICYCCFNFRPNPRRRRWNQWRSQIWSLRRTRAVSSPKPSTDSIFSLVLQHHLL